MPNDLNLNNSIIAFENVSKFYEPQHDAALKNASFSVKEGEFLCIVGPSGGGKSTVLKIIAGLEIESSGAVKKPGQIAMAFQSGALLPWLTVFDNAAFGLEAAGAPKAVIKREVGNYLGMMRLWDSAGKYPADLSGGERQRVGIARALAVNPKVLLLDEPFSALDAKTTEELHQDLLAIWRQTKKTIVMVSHSIEEAVSLSERVLLLKNFTVAGVFPITLDYPRHEQGESFLREIQKIRKEFFR